MSSITKHQYDFTNGKCANKENVSTTNGKRSEVTKSSSGIDSNFDWAEKQAISQQRKLRLIQVTIDVNLSTFLYEYFMRTLTF